MSSKFLSKMPYVCLCCSFCSTSSISAHQNYLIACFMSIFRKLSEQVSMLVSEASLSIATFEPGILAACLFHQVAVPALPQLLCIQ
jgi:hypothetical protein